MEFYQDIVFPTLMHGNIGKKSILKKQAALLKHTYGSVLEIGIGEGTNLPLYPTEITHISRRNPKQRFANYNFQIAHAPIYPRFFTGYVYSGITKEPLQENA